MTPILWWWDQSWFQCTAKIGTTDLGGRGRDQEDRPLTGATALVGVFYLGHLQGWLSHLEGSVQNAMQMPYFLFKKKGEMYLCRYDNVKIFPFFRGLFLDLSWCFLFAI